MLGILNYKERTIFFVDAIDCNAMNSIEYVIYVCTNYIPNVTYKQKDFFFSSETRGKVKRYLKNYYFVNLPSKNYNTPTFNKNLFKLL